MPKIREYSQQSQVVGPVVQGVPIDGNYAGAGLQKLGAATEGFGEAIEKRAAQSEVSDLNAKFAEAHANFTSSWRQTLATATPGDNTIAEKFIGGYDDYMSKLQDNVETRAGSIYFKETQAHLRAHFLETATAGQVELAGVKAKQDYVNSVDYLSSSLINDPSSFGTAMTLHERGLDNLVKSGGLPSAAAEQLKTQGKEALAKSAVRGWIQLDPEGTKKQLTDGKWDGLIDGEVKHQLLGEVKTQITANETEANRRRIEQERAQALQQQQTQDGFLKKLVDKSLSTDDVLKSNLDPFGSGSKEQFIQLIKAAQDRPIKTDSGTWQNLYSRIHLPDGDPKKLVDENELNAYVIAGKLSYEDLNHLRGEVQGSKTTDGKNEGELKKRLMDYATSKLVKANPMLGIRDPEGEEQLLKFQTHFFKEYQDQRKNGKSAMSLLDPGSPDYLGKSVNNFVKTPQQIIRDQINASGISTQPSPGLSPTPDASGLPNSLVPPQQQVPTQAPAPNPEKSRRPGESPADFLKRTGG